MSETRTASRTLATGAVILLLAVAWVVGPGARTAWAQGSNPSCGDSSGTFSSIQSNFNGTYIHAGNWIWFTAVMKVQNSGNQPVILYFRHQNISSPVFNLSPPPAEVTISTQFPEAETAFGEDIDNDNDAAEDAGWCDGLPRSS